MILINHVQLQVEVKIRHSRVIGFSLISINEFFQIEREVTINMMETSSLASYTAKLDDFFNGIFIPAALSFENIREQIRIDQEKTWQGIKEDTNTNDTPWPKQYAVLIQ